jgi:hypothetical protein
MKARVALWDGIGLTAKGRLDQPGPPIVNKRTARGSALCFYHDATTSALFRLLLPYLLGGCTVWKR